MICHSYCTEHCYHVHHGPIWMVVPDGHVVIRCCKCGATKLEHREHLSCHPVVPCHPTTWVTRDWSFRPTSVRSGSWT